MPAKNGDVEKRAEFLSLRQELLIELDGGLSAHGIRHRRRAHLRHSVGWVIARRTANTLRRVGDATLAALLLILLSPIALIAILVATLSGGGITKQERLGRWATRFNLYQLDFPKSSFLSKFTLLQQFPELYNVLRGESSLKNASPGSATTSAPACSASGGFASVPTSPTAAKSASTLST